MTITWTDRQNKQRSEALRGRKLSVETRARMSAARRVGADKVGTLEYNAAVTAYIQTEELRERLAAGIETGKINIRGLDPDDPRYRPYTVTYRKIRPVALARAIRSQRLDEHLSDIAEATKH